MPANTMYKTQQSNLIMLDGSNLTLLNKSNY